MEFLINNWYLIIFMLAVVFIIGHEVGKFSKFSQEQQCQKVEEWLLWAVAKAEKELGSGTGQLKLHYVYDLFLLRFPALAKVISFEQFSLLVNKALEKFEKILKENQKIELYVEGE